MRSFSLIAGTDQMRLIEEKGLAVRGRIVGCKRETPTIKYCEIS